MKHARAVPSVGGGGGGGGGGAGLPAAPSTDGTYELLVSGGVASWVDTTFNPTLTLASGGAGPFVLGATWTPTVNGNPAANGSGVTAFVLKDSDGASVTESGAGPYAAPSGSHSYTKTTPQTVSLFATVTKTGGGTKNTGNVNGVYASRTFSGVGTAGATSATASGTNAALVGATGTLTGSAAAVANPVGQSFTEDPVNQKIYDLVVHTATPHTYQDSNGQPVLMGPGGNGVPTTFSFSNENGVAALFDLYETSNLLTGHFVITRKT